MANKDTINHKYQIFIAAISLILAACSQQDTIGSSLQTIQSIISASNAHNKVHYQLSYDADFPCKVSLQENWQDAENYWQQTYRFDLTDIEPDTFIQSKSGRRAVVYTGFKESHVGLKKEFSEKRINNIRYRASLDDKDQRLIIDAMNKAIALCEEEYLF